MWTTPEQAEMSGDGSEDVGCTGGMDGEEGEFLGAVGDDVDSSVILLGNRGGCFTKMVGW